MIKAGLVRMVKAMSYVQLVSTSLGSNEDAVHADQNAGINLDCESTPC